MAKQRTRAEYVATRPIHLWLDLNLVKKFDMLADALNITRTAAIRGCLEKQIDHLLTTEVPTALAKRNQREAEMLMTLEKR